MAASKCVNCGGTAFQMVEQNYVAGTDLKWNFIQCSSCGDVIGVVDYYSIGGILRRLDRIEKKLGIR